MELHDYQQECINDLSAFLGNLSDMSPREAFKEITQGNHGKYQPAHGMPESMPYICIRIPTGGGKTLMAAHALVAAKGYLGTDTPVCLWLAPSNAIVEQTLKSLQDRGHPCRQALAKYRGDINCISITDALRISKHSMECGVTVIVATIQSLRVEKTEGRKVYDANGNLMSHFDSLPEKLKNEDDNFNYSLNDALRLREPMIISDEAHNASTELSYETLARFNPSCIVEFTATPQLSASNVLSQASARELKKAHMVKLPINLEVRDNWRENMRAAIAKREELEKTAVEAAKKSGEYIRPIVLYQAENIDGDATVETVCAALENDFGIPQGQIAKYTGVKKELKGIDLLSPDCPLRHIVTVRALAEGWDCAFAYVLCTMANLQSGRSVEQVLGRILRLPYAAEKKESVLNECYAFATSDNFYNAAFALKDALINGAGFQKMEARDFISGHSTDQTGRWFDESKGASTKLSPGIKPLSVPLLMVRESGALQFLESSDFLDAQWSIAKEKFNAAGFSFPRGISGKSIIGVNEKGEIITRERSPLEKQYQEQLLLEADKRWTVTSLVAWLDAEIPHSDISQAQSLPYILAAVNGLEKNFGLEKLARHRFYIKERIEAAINKLRQEKREQGYQRMLKEFAVDGGKLQVSPKSALTFERHCYAAHWECETSDVFGKHLFPAVGELKSDGEEWECARYLDEHEKVEVWVRNLERRDNSFWLQTSSDKFYPDFVARLKNGKILAVEYKGEDRWSNDDSKEKRAIGELWAKLSKGQCLFVMPKGMDWDAIEGIIRG